VIMVMPVIIAMRGVVMRGVTMARTPARLAGKGHEEQKVMKNRRQE